MAKVELHLDELVDILRKNNWLGDKVSSVSSTGNKITIKAKVMFTIDVTIIFEGYADGILTLGIDTMPLVKPFITNKVKEESVSKYASYENDKLIVQLNKLLDRKVSGLGVKEVKFSDGNLELIS